MIDEYFENVQKLAMRACEESLTAMEILEGQSGSVELARKLIDDRSLFVSDPDRERCSVYLETGYFNDLSDDKKVAAWMTLFELQNEMTVISLRKTCEPYSKNQPLFQSSADLWDKVRISGDRPPELIDISGIRWDPSGQLALLKSTKARLGNHLRPELLNWLRTYYADCDLFARLDPYDVGHDLNAVLNEEIIRPIDPKWWKNLSIWENTKSAGIYELSQCSPEEDLGKFWEYSTKNFGRFEVQFRRDNVGVLSGMLEELPRDSGDKCIIGYCLHLTSDSPTGTKWDEAVATHIDGSINVYTDDAIAKRLAGTLAEGKVCDATFRTHVFRADNIPLKTLVPLACMFFRSKYLLADWLADQFKELAQ